MSQSDTQILAQSLIGCLNDLSKKSADEYLPNVELTHKSGNNYKKFQKSCDAIQTYAKNLLAIKEYIADIDDVTFMRNILNKYNDFNNEFNKLAANYKDTYRSHNFNSEPFFDETKNDYIKK